MDLRLVPTTYVHTICVASICLDQYEDKRELFAVKRKKLQDEYKAMVAFVEEDRRIRKTERKEITDKVNACHIE